MFSHAAAWARVSVAGQGEDCIDSLEVLARSDCHLKSCMKRDEHRKCRNRLLNILKSARDNESRGTRNTPGDLLDTVPPVDLLVLQIDIELEESDPGGKNPPAHELPAAILCVCGAFSSAESTR